MRWSELLRGSFAVLPPAEPPTPHGSCPAPQSLSLGSLDLMATFSFQSAFDWTWNHIVGLSPLLAVIPVAGLVIGGITLRYLFIKRREERVSAVAAAYASAVRSFPHFDTQSHTLGVLLSSGVLTLPDNDEVLLAADRVFSLGERHPFEAWRGYVARRDWRTFFHIAHTEGESLSDFGSVSSFILSVQHRKQLKEAWDERPKAT